MSNEHSLTIKEEENFYPGYQELSTFVLETENPTLEAFAYKYKHEIVKWNEYNNWTSYATVWSRRYLNKMSDLRPDVKTNTRCKKTIWQEIYLLKEAITKHRLESIKTATLMAHVANQAIRDIIEK